MVFMVPLLLMFLSAPQSSARHLYAMVAIVVSVGLLTAGTTVFSNAIGYPSDNAEAAAKAIQRGGYLEVQTQSWADYSCLRFYLRRERWPGTISVVEDQNYHARWFFAGQTSGVPVSTYLPANYQKTLIIGLYFRQPGN
jgi:hypothetical protein